MQPVHATSDKNMAEDRVGPERIKYSYAWRKVIDAGSHIIGGSDAPVELVNPFHGLYAAVTRMDREGNPDGGWYPEESMTREEALKAFTIWAAEGSFEEKIKGSLEIGKLADFIVIDKDPMKCQEEQLKDIQVLTTVLGGEVVYKK
ncbi:amidohydrolase family protein [Peribacillus muralis]|uniref:amidohydrolase family protein n=1 Tax=Peribacillus muralis TaxID=264697 RepID=UPI00070B0D97|nr:amidohydrolase family protein [Peribacillus muralis]